MKTFATIVADPPWDMRWSGGTWIRKKGNGRVYRSVKQPAKRLPYETLTIAAIAAMRIGDLAAERSHLWLWVPDTYVLNGAATNVCRAWGFVPYRFIVWAKANFGLGAFPRPQHELLLLARRGGLPYAKTLRRVGSVQTWKQPYFRVGRGAAKRHSAKPEEAYRLVELASPGPYLELFARRRRRGWSAWGNEVVTDVTIADEDVTAFGPPATLPLFS